MSEKRRNPDGTFMSFDQVVDDISSAARSETHKLRAWQEVARADLYLGHHSTGQAIRNAYGLWDTENPYTKVGNAFVNDKGVADHPDHADQFSMRVMEAVWDRLNGMDAVWDRPNETV